jgi:hypothetical protein
MDEVFGTSRGVTASSRQRGAVEEHILALEARNPQPRPTSVSEATQLVAPVQLALARIMMAALRRLRERLNFFVNISALKQAHTPLVPIPHSAWK